jgi:excisionase family DNA binding protein
MTVNEAAVKLGTSGSNVRDAIARGALAAQKHGRDWWLDPAEVERYGRENRYATKRKGAEA